MSASTVRQTRVRMLGKHHVMIGCAGLLAAGVLCRNEGLQLLHAPDVTIGETVIPGLPLLFLATAVGSLLPDIDHPGSAISETKIAGAPVLKPASHAISAVVGHRGATHSLLACALLLLFVGAFASQYGYQPFVLALGIGYALHLLADGFTRSGVPLLWPLTRFSFGFPPISCLRFSTGGFLERVFTFSSVGACAWLVFTYGWPSF